MPHLVIAAIALEYPTHRLFIPPESRVACSIATPQSALETPFFFSLRELRESAGV